MFVVLQKEIEGTANLPQNNRLTSSSFSGLICTGLNHFVSFEVNVAIHCSKRNTVTEISKPLPREEPDSFYGGSGGVRVWQGRKGGEESQGIQGLRSAE